jgi:hypothetical protein
VSFVNDKRCWANILKKCCVWLLFPMERKWDFCDLKWRMTFGGLSISVSGVVFYAFSGKNISAIGKCEGANVWGKYSNPLLTFLTCVWDQKLKKMS